MGRAIPLQFVLEELGHAKALCGIVRFTRKQQFDTEELLRTPDPAKPAERALVLPVLKDLKHAGALCGKARFTGKHQFGPAELPRVPQIFQNIQNWHPFCLFERISVMKGLFAALFALQENNKLTPQSP